MKQNYDFLPRKFTKEEVALAPLSWTRILSSYSSRRRKAVHETKPGYNTLIATILASIAKQDKSLIDVAKELTKENVPRNIYLSLIGSALCIFNAKKEGLAMLREAVELQPLEPLILAGETDDLDEKENLAKRVLTNKPTDITAIGHLASAKYFKGEQEEAVHLINKILSVEPHNIYALEYKGNMCFDFKEYDKSLEAYLKIKIKPMPVSLQFKICRCYYLLGKIRNAKRIAKKIKDKVAYDYELKEKIDDTNKMLAEILER